MIFFSLLLVAAFGFLANTYKNTPPPLVSLLLTWKATCYSTNMAIISPPGQSHLVGFLNKAICNWLTRRTFDGFRGHLLEPPISVNAVLPLSDDDTSHE